MSRTSHGPAGGSGIEANRESASRSRAACLPGTWSTRRARPRRVRRRVHALSRVVYRRVAPSYVTPPPPAHDRVRHRRVSSRLAVELVYFGGHESLLVRSTATIRALFESVPNTGPWLTHRPLRCIDVKGDSINGRRRGGMHCGVFIVAADATRLRSACDEIIDDCQHARSPGWAHEQHAAVHRLVELPGTASGC